MKVFLAGFVAIAESLLIIPLTCGLGILVVISVYYVATAFLYLRFTHQRIAENV